MTTIVCDRDGNLLWAGATVPGRMHDQTAVKCHATGSVIEWFPGAGVLAGAGYRGLAKDHPGHVVAPPLKPGKNATSEQVREYEETRHAQSSARIPVEHANAKLKRWRCLQRWNGRRETLPEVILAVAGLVSPTAAA